MRMSGRYSLLVLFNVLPVLLAAQAPLYDPASVRELRFYFGVSDWRRTLDSLYVVGADERLLGDLYIDGAFLPDVGVRHKGYSSFAVGRLKNPFNIKLDEVHAGQDYQGFEKLKLSNVIQDPSFLREVLAYEVARAHMPASRANYANLYVNDELVGLYTNVEDVGKDFLDERFGEKNGSLFKGNPPTVDLTGDNCNLSDAPGTDSTDYYGIYELQSDAGWAHLLELIHTLNQEPAAIEEVLNVDRTLWMHAFNYALINFDSYVGYAQNYYLYRSKDGLWNPIVWDLNMSFASFRLTDASTYWNGFSIAQARTLDPLSHLNGPSVFPRPLMRRLLEQPMYRRMYLAHLRTLIQEHFAGGQYRDRAVELQTLIAPYVQADTNKFYTDQAFMDNLDNTVAFTVAYPGITELMDARSTYLMGYPGMSGQPVIGGISVVPELPTVGTVITLTLPVQNADTVLLFWRNDRDARYIRAGLWDDGTHGDGAAGDGVFGIQLPLTTGLLEYYVYAENAEAGAFLPVNATHETFSLVARVTPGMLVINELMAVNEGLVVDPTGATPDWVELYNRSAYTVCTAGLHLSDDASDPVKWALPVTTLSPGEYLIIWADERNTVGDDHASFRLDGGGETVLLAYDSAAVIDQVSFGEQYPLQSWGRLPNGTGPFQRLKPTAEAYNRTQDDMHFSRSLRLWPNPATDEINVFVDVTGTWDAQILRPDGRALTPVQHFTEGHQVLFDTRTVTAGHYILHLRTEVGVIAKPFIILP
jgi:hypothetical protein